MMKYSVAVVALVCGTASAQINPSGMPNAIWNTAWGDWLWCCTDSEGRCPDACARVSQGPGEYWYDLWGPGSANYIAQENGADQPDLENAPPLDGDTDLIVTKCNMIHNLNCCVDPGVCGDPHFKTWSGDFYDYQGQCELKFLSAPDFGAGLGLDIHIRTKIQNSYSFVESAAIKIGDDVLEVGSWGEYFLNGVEDAELPAMMGGKFPVAYFQRSAKEHVFDIFLGDDRRILIKNLKEWVSIHIDNPNHVDFVSSVGMMGNFITGARLGRDGETVIEDENAFGQEWQVQPDEPQLFVSNSFEPAHPTQCVLPVVDEEAAATQRRLLEERGVTREKAEAACSHMHMHQEFCIRDVLAAADLDVAGAF